MYSLLLKDAAARYLLDFFHQTIWGPDFGILNFVEKFENSYISAH